MTRAFKQWNNIIREQLRAETALRLTVGDDAQTVPVRVVDGLPRPLAEVVDRFSGLEWLLLNRPLVEAAARGAALLYSNYEQACALFHDGSFPAVRDNLSLTQKAAEQLLEKLEEAKAIQQIGGIQEDVLGAYFFLIPEIRLYWLAIGIVALALNLSPEALAIVVLTHELVHAYTHLGRDIDNERWDTGAFQATELPIVEGLAQFYTSVVCKKLEQRIPAAWQAYQVLLELQQGPYKVHTKWIRGGEASGEIVRVSMIQCRSRLIKDIKSFEEVLAQHWALVRGKH